MSKIGPEHSLQVLVAKWVRQNVIEPHFFHSADRSKAHSRFQHVYEKNRGAKKGFPDTLLFVGGRVIAVELKAPGNEPDDTQRKIGHAIIATGNNWYWCDSVARYAGILAISGVKLYPNAALNAQAHDATLASAAIRREEASGKVSKRRFNLKAQVDLLGADSLLPDPKPMKKRAPAKPSAAKLRAMQGVRERAAAKGVRM